MFVQFKLKSTLTNHSDDVNCFTRYNNLLVSASDDKTIKIWNDRDECITTFNADHWISCLTVFKDMIISGGYKGMIQYWNSSTGKCIKSIKGHYPFYTWALIVINNLLYSGGGDGNIMVWTEDGERIRTIKAHSNYDSCLIEFKGMLISGSYDNTIKCWSLSSYNCIMTLEGHSNGIRCLAVYDDKYLLSGSWDGTMKLWDVTEGSSSSCIRTFEHEDLVTSILVVDLFIISGDNRGNIYIWSFEGNLLEIIDALSDCVNSLIVHQNYIYSGSEDKTIRKWSFRYLKMKRQALLAFHVMKTLKDADDDMKLCLLLTFFYKKNNILSYSQLKNISDHACSSMATVDFLPLLLQGEREKDQSKYD